MVRLEAYTRQIKAELSDLCFNSNMVRLEAITTRI